MGTLCFWAMYPRKEKTTKPEEKLVSELTEVVMIASLREQDRLSQPGRHCNFPSLLLIGCLRPAGAGRSPDVQAGPPVTPEPVLGCPAEGGWRPVTAGSRPPGPPAEQLWALATTLAWGPRSSRDSQLSADGETIPQARPGSGGQPR